MKLGVPYTTSVLKCLVITCVLLASLDLSPVRSDNFTIGYLYADQSKEFIKNKQGRIISGAMTYAVEWVNQDPRILAGHRLSYMKRDTFADTLVGTKMLTELWREGAIAFIGPEDSCDVEARVAAAWNLPMLSYVSAVLHVQNIVQYIVLICVVGHHAVSCEHTNSTLRPRSCFVVCTDPHISPSV